MIAVWLYLPAVMPCGLAVLSDGGSAVLNTSQLDSWLAAIEDQHPDEIVLGLSRIQPLADKMQLLSPSHKTVVVAGTNGKGSCIAVMEQLALHFGLKVAAYTSPHLLYFNERLRLNGQPLDDTRWCQAFAAVEGVRTGLDGDLPQLTFFEFTTLAALWLIRAADVDLALLEVGLGGRLDAVNIVAADVAVICSVDIDHQNWLGADRESIGAEKAAVIRPGAAVVCGDRSPPDSLLKKARSAGFFYRIGDHFDGCFRLDGSWRWHGLAAGRQCHFEAEQGPRLADESVAVALQSWLCLYPQTVSSGWWRSAVDCTLVGRFQFIQRGVQQLLLDVAHNPAAAQQLADTIGRHYGQQRLTAVCGMCLDKDARGFGAALAGRVAKWYPTAPATPRAMPADQLAANLSQSHPSVATPAASVSEALHNAFSTATDNEPILVCGSFFTVAEILNPLNCYKVEEVA